MHRRYLPAYPDTYMIREGKKKRPASVLGRSAKIAKMQYRRKSKGAKKKRAITYHHKNGKGKKRCQCAMNPFSTRLHSRRPCRRRRGRRSAAKRRDAVWMYVCRLAYSGSFVNLFRRRPVLWSILPQKKPSNMGGLFCKLTEHVTHSPGLLGCNLSICARWSLLFFLVVISSSACVRGSVYTS